MVQFLRSPGSSSQKSHTWMHSWDVWQSWELSCNRLWTQRRWQEAHFALHSCTPAFKSTVTLSNALRSSSMLAWLAWKRERFKVIHSRTCSTRISAILLRCTESFKAHSASGISWREWAWSHVPRKVASASSRGEFCMPAVAKKKRAEVSGLSTKISVSKFFQLSSVVLSACR